MVTRHHVDAGITDVKLGISTDTQALLMLTQVLLMLLSFKVNSDLRIVPDFDLPRLFPQGTHQVAPNS